jgi:hypothetical protein
MAMYTTVDKNGNINHNRMEIEVSQYVYDFLAMSAQGQGYSNMHDYVVSNLSKEYGEKDVTVTYSEVKTDDKVKMIIDVKGNIKQDEDSGMKVVRDGDFMVYEYLSSGSTSNGYSQYTDTSTMSDAMLNGIKLDYYLEMPGKIVDSNADVVKGNKAEWHLVGKNISRMDRLYARSDIAKSPGFESIAALLAIAGCVYLLALRKKD